MWISELWNTTSSWLEAPNACTNLDVVIYYGALFAAVLSAAGALMLARAASDYADRRSNGGENDDC